MPAKSRLDAPSAIRTAVQILEISEESKMQGMPGWMKWTIALLIGLAIILVGFRYAGWLLSAFFVMNCLVLIIVVLLQSGKAADLAGAFGGAGSQTAFGPRGAASLLSQATTWCAVMFMICAMALVLRTDKFTSQGNSVLEKFSKPTAATPKPAPTSAVPTIPQSTTAPTTKPPATTPTPQPKKP
jgi:preprotein translocase subunit SecG